MGSESTSNFRRCRERVREMASGGEPIAKVEGMLVEADLPDDEKDALWLVGWVLSEDPRAS